MQTNQEGLSKAENVEDHTPDWERMFIYGASHFIKLMDYRCTSNNT